MTTTTVARYHCAPGDRPAILAILEPARKATTTEIGCEYFLVLLPDDAPDEIILIEGWRSSADLDAHRKSPHFQSIILGEIAPRLLGRDVAISTPLHSYLPSSTP